MCGKELIDTGMFINQRKGQMVQKKKHYQVIKSEFKLSER